MITDQYVVRSPNVKFEEPERRPCCDFIKPELKQLEIHHFSHHGTAALSLEGNNLCFTYKVMLYLLKSKREYTILVDQKESVSSRSIQKHQVSLTLPEESATSSDVNDYQEIEEMANVCLFTHFGEFYFSSVKVRHKV